MMGGGDKIRPVLFDQALKRFAAVFARFLFQAPAAFFCEGGDICGKTKEGHPRFSAQIFHESGIGKALFPADAVFDVDCRKRDMKLFRVFPKNEEQRDRIRPARKGDADPLARTAGKIDVGHAKSIPQNEKECN